MIITRLSGGMGNQMFQYALGRAVSLKYDVPLKLDITFLENQTAIPFFRKGFVRRPYALDVFGIDASIAEKKYIPWYGRPFLFGWPMQAIDALLRKIPMLPGWERKFQFDSCMLSVGPHAYLSGFWQSEKYFMNITDTIRKDFVLKEPLRGDAHILQQEIQGCNSVCLHVRRSDIAAKSFHGAVGKEYYEKGIVEISKSAQIDRLYVFSDDISWCKQHLKFEYHTVFVDQVNGGKHGEMHLELMRACKHFVIPNSTFSWWAAWLADSADKLVVAPQKWFNTAALDSADLVPPEWIRM